MRPGRPFSMKNRVFSTRFVPELHKFIEIPKISVVKLLSYPSCMCSMIVGLGELFCQ